MLSKGVASCDSLSRSPELRADVLGLERPADRHPPLQRDEHREVDRAALAEHTNLTVEKIIRSGDIKFVANN